MCQDLKWLSPLKIKAYKIDLKQFNMFMQHKDCLAKECMSAYIDETHKQYKPKSAKRKIACIKAFYHYMEMENMIDSNPFHKIRIKYKEPIVLPKTIPLNNVELILKYAYDTYHRCQSRYQKEITLRNVLILELLFSTGMRVSEVSHLKIKSIDLNSNTIYILGKGSKERIMCIADKHITDMLKQYLTLRKCDNNYIFINKLGNNYSEQSIRNMVNNYSKAAGVTRTLTSDTYSNCSDTVLL